MFASPVRCELVKTNYIISFIRCCSSLYTNISNSEKSINLPDFETRLLKVGVIGVPNSGKSTLINNLMDRKACPTSSKVHTTRSRSMAIFTEGESQIVFLDTPGLVNEKEKKKFNLENAFIRDSTHALNDADMIGVVHDTSNTYTRENLDIKIIKLLEDHKEKSSFLVLNKIDILKSKRKLLDITRLITDNCIDGKPVPGRTHSNREQELNKDFRGWPYFKDIFMVSALTGDGLQEIKSYLINNAKPAKWMFPDGVWTDQSAENIIQSSVQAKLLDFLPQEIPYALKSQIEYFDISEEGVITTVVLVKTPSARISKLVAGASDGKLKQIIQSVQEDLQNAFQNFVRIKIVLDPPPSIIKV